MLPAAPLQLCGPEEDPISPPHLPTPTLCAKWSRDDDGSCWVCLLICKMGPGQEGSSVYRQKSYRPAVMGGTGTPPKDPWGTLAPAADNQHLIKAVHQICPQVCPWQWATPLYHTDLRQARLPHPWGLEKPKGLDTGAFGKVESGGPECQKDAALAIIKHEGTPKHPKLEPREPGCRTLTLSTRVPPSAEHSYYQGSME